MLKSKVSEDLKTAMKAQDKEKLSVLRTLKSEIERSQANPKEDLDDAKVISIVKKMIEGVKETTKNQTEIDILEGYMPQQLDEARIVEKILQLKNDGVTNLGQVMGFFSKNFAGLYNGKFVSTKAKEILQ